MTVSLVSPLVGLTVFEVGPKKTDKRKKVQGGEANNIHNYLGPWAKYVDEKDGAKPSEVINKSIKLYYVKLKQNLDAWIIQQQCGYLDITAFPQKRILSDSDRLFSADWSVGGTEGAG